MLISLRKIDKAKSSLLKLKKLVQGTIYMLYD